MDDPLHWKRLFTLGPAQKDHRAALRAGFGVFIPLLVLVGIDRIDLALFAVFAAFTNIYGRGPSFGLRLRAQLRGGGLMWLVILAALLAGSVLDTDTDAGMWIAIALTTLISGACSVATGLLQIRPAGSLFHIFAFAAVATLPFDVHLGEALITATATFALGLLLGQTGRWWQPEGDRLRAEAQPNPFGVRVKDTVRKAVWIESVGYLVAAAAAGALAHALQPVLSTDHTYWAMVAAVVPLVGHTTRDRVARGVHRVLGTVVGLGLMAAVIWAGPPTWILLLIIGLLQFGTEMLIIRNYFWAQVCVTPLALIGVSLAQGLQTSLLYDRIIETAIGSAVGIAVVLAGSAYGRFLLRRGRETGD
ncbi:FUSC family protein [Zhihengliuella salsuginis]|uniref:FUSC family protein n=1 Tax=Zhihengliuella salsuginis TaxID=578222 RepID=A0ABQ3GBM7_9MICC|nr:FUSC family protein [Zhihengliuella salsuginis]GHD00510.1 FUSC family protein [Zhihengliuella salsuginis]